jgi:hypothetical protein
MTVSDTVLVRMTGAERVVGNYRSGPLTLRKQSSAVRCNGGYSVVRDQY